MRELLPSGPSGQTLASPPWTLLPSRNKPPTPSRPGWSHKMLQTWGHGRTAQIIISPPNSLVCIMFDHLLPIWSLWWKVSGAGGGDWPSTWGDGSIRIGCLVSVDGGQYLSFQIPDVDAGVNGGTHDELACKRIKIYLYNQRKKINEIQRILYKSIIPYTDINVALINIVMLAGDQILYVVFFCSDSAHTSQVYGK